MKKTLFILITLLIFLTCSNAKKQQDSINQEGTLYVFHPGMNQPRINEYELSISENDTTTNYSYIYKKNNKTGMEFSYDKIAKKVIFVKAEFMLSDKAKYIDNHLLKFTFDTYEINVDDRAGSILFNADYGVLDLKTGIGSNPGPHFIFISDKHQTLSNKIIAGLNK